MGRNQRICKKKTMSASVTHFEIYAEDLTGLATFYRELFDWKIEQAPAIDYFHIQTGSAGNPGIGGGMLYRPIQGPRSWVHYVLVDSIDQTIERVERLGGKQLRPKAAVPKTAWYAVLEDPEGNIFAVYEHDPLAMPLPEPED
jgi:predicted enzyme related to lactoylglutathione lyase